MTRRDIQKKEAVGLYTDQTLTCADCGAEFTFTAGEQEFHASKGFTSSPRRCPACRRARKGLTGAPPADNRPPRQMFTVNCASCGNPAQVPFEPRGDRPVYCSNCFTPRPRTGGGGGGYSGGGGGGYSSGGGGGYSSGGGGGFGGGGFGGGGGGFGGGGGGFGGGRDSGRGGRSGGGGGRRGGGGDYGGRGGGGWDDGGGRDGGGRRGRNW